jgi:hypothetical protein
MLFGVLEDLIVQLFTAVQEDSKKEERVLLTEDPLHE